ncbi:hypothetical protein AXF42_Ash007351 [Apostasia shenzhenica]|uniref:Uncharacterized protein n=1 Tax=Apostasia shenzhenica TaxID=1088818 RepID=A0A2I0B9Y0_9ASPA|nr:hypothetical protein AXF42_Ash007351 [Apostasia shenzhenica]
MGALGNGGLWWNFPPGRRNGGRGRRRPSCRKVRCSSSESINLGKESVSRWALFNFPLKQAAIAASLTLTGDTIAQFRDWINDRSESRAGMGEEGCTSLCSCCIYVYLLDFLELLSFINCKQMICPSYVSSFAFVLEYLATCVSHLMFLVQLFVEVNSFGLKSELL